jgi:hypothetical protein
MLVSAQLVPSALKLLSVLTRLALILAATAVLVLVPTAVVLARLLAFLLSWFFRVLRVRGFSV